MNNLDEDLMEEARARVGFKQHLRTYLAVNVFIWLLWFFTSARHGSYHGFWPIWATFGWGIGLFSHYMGVYHKNESAVNREYEKLKREKGGESTSSELDRTYK